MNASFVLTSLHPPARSRFTVPCRHNGNILLDALGRVIHIDFGFILANSPGGNLGFEQAPFKMTRGFLKLMGGTRSRCFRDFRELCVETFLALRRSSQVRGVCGSADGYLGEVRLSSRCKTALSVAHPGISVMAITTYAHRGAPVRANMALKPVALRYNEHILKVKHL